MLQTSRQWKLGQAELDGLANSLGVIQVLQEVNDGRTVVLHLGLALQLQVSRHQVTHCLHGFDDGGLQRENAQFRGHSSKEHHIIRVIFCGGEVRGQAVTVT